MDILNHKDNMGLCELEELEGYIMLIISALCDDNELSDCIVSTKLFGGRMGSILTLQFICINYFSLD